MSDLCLNRPGNRREASNGPGTTKMFEQLKLTVTGRPWYMSEESKWLIARVCERLSLHELCSSAILPPPPPANPCPHHGNDTYVCECEKGIYTGNKFKCLRLFSMKQQVSNYTNILLAKDMFKVVKLALLQL